VALMVALPLLFAPLPRLIGFRSDTIARRSAGAACPTSGWARCCSSAGSAIMPFALLVLSGEPMAPAGHRRRPGLPAGRRRPAHDADRGLALATDLAPSRPGRAWWRCCT
jgi:MFS transporter, BCD family, chlorophyll transporter